MVGDEMLVIFCLVAAWKVCASRGTGRCEEAIKLLARLVTKPS